MKKILNIAWFDCAGIMDKFKSNFDKYSNDYKWTNIIFNGSSLSFNYDKLIIEYTIEQLKKEIDESDIIIIHPFINGGDNIMHYMDDWNNMIYKDFNIYAYIKNKKHILFLNGSSNLRQYSKYYSQTFLKDKNIMVSTPDLNMIFPNTFYSPAFLDLDKPLYFPLDYNLKNKKFRITHCPTDTRIKNTNEFKYIIYNIKKKYKDIEFSILTHVPNNATLAFKRASHLNLDHLQGYYGVNSLESAACGVPNILSLHPKVKEIFCEIAGTETLPWINITHMNHIAESIIHLYESKDYYKKESKRIRDWMTTYWYPEKHVRRMEDYFNSI